MEQYGDFFPTSAVRFEQGNVIFLADLKAKQLYLW